MQRSATTLGREASAEHCDTEYSARFLNAATSEVLWSGSVGGNTLAVSGGVHHVCGFTPAEILETPGNIWLTRAHPDDLVRVEDAYRLLVVTGAAFDEEYRWQHRDGAWLWLRARAILRAVDAPIVDALFVDVTAQKQLEDQIHHLQNIDTIGQFTSGIAHDFNNLLAVILANASLVVDALPPGDVRRADAEGIGDAAQRAAALTRQLLACTRRRPFTPRILNVNEVVVNAEKMLRRVIGEDVEFTMDLSSGLGSVRADAGLLEQVLMNLVVNARDAMPEGGKLSIQTSQVTAGRAAPRAAGRATPGTSVRLLVSDTGCGMDSATRRRIFEPFFTTKPRDQGTGLGLSTCYRIVTQAGGSIHVDSEPGTGSVFEVLLPIVNEAIAAGAPVADMSAPRGTETILIVEDDAGVRSLVQKMLSRLGYHVLSAVDGQEALAILHSHDAPIDLVLCDVVMPDVNGAEVVGRVQVRSRGTRALFMSGHTADSLVKNGTLQAGHALIHKPFTSPALARKIREVLDA